MTPREQLCLHAAISGRRHLVEYGAGGSTVAALSAGVGRIDTVEADAGWIDRLRARRDVTAAIAAGRLVVHAADIGPVGEWSFPTDPSTTARWPDYALRVWRELPDGGRGVDAVLVDGRFRAACILAAIRHVRPGTPVIVHDFWNRPEYAVVLPVVVPLLRAETLAILVAREPVDRQAIERLGRDVALDSR